MADRRAQIRVSGRVQGVWYRGSTEQHAGSLGLRGWVRNRPDGTVEIEAQGPSDAIDALIQWCHEGPPSARVTLVEVTPVATRDDETDFHVRY